MVKHATDGSKPQFYASHTPFTPHVVAEEEALCALHVAQTVRRLHHRLQRALLRVVLAPDGVQVVLLRWSPHTTDTSNTSGVSE